MDRYDDFQDACRQCASSLGHPEAYWEWSPSSSLLAPLPERPQFYQQAVKLHNHISSVSSFVNEHRKDFVLPGRCSEADKDGIEAEVSRLTKTCSAAIGALSSAAAAATPGLASGLSATQIAHYHGLVLILTTELSRATSTFAQLQAARQSQQRHPLPQLSTPPPSLRAVARAARSASAARTGASRASTGPATPGRAPPGSSTAGAATPSADAGFPEPAFLTPPAATPAATQASHQAQLQLDAEHLELIEELAERYEQVEGIERSMYEVSSLNRAFASHLLTQTEQIEALYNQALEATNHIAMGNVQLNKTVSVNKGSGWTMFFFLFGAGLLLLFLDWQAG